MEAKDLYKLMRFPSLADALAKRSKNIIAERQEKRRECFWGSRVDLNRSPAAEKKKPSRAEMLKKWKEEKVKKLEEEKKKQKPIFKVGIVHRKVTGSPALTQPNTLKKTTVAQQTFKKPQRNDAQVERTQIVTRAKARNFGLAVKVAEVKPVAKPQKGFNNKFYKIEAGKKKQIDSHVFKVPEIVSKLPCQGLTYPYSPKVLKRKERASKLQTRKLDMKATQGKQQVRGKTQNGRELSNEENTREDKIMENCLEENTEEFLEEMVTQKENQQEEVFKENAAEEHVEVKKTEESITVEVNVQSETVSTPEKTVKEDDFRPIIYSPFVTVRSGRKSKRKSKKSLIMDVEEQIKKEESEFHCRIFSFRKYIECERKRLLDTCDKWKKIYEEFEEVPAEVEGDIDSVVGKTNLLTSDKFMQFKGLIDKCENGDPFVKVDDLQGFQDWVSIEVERIDEEFHKLEKLKCNNWKSEAVSVEVTKVHKVKVTKNVPKKPAASSSIRSHILAARKLLKEGNANGAGGVQLPTAAFELAVKATTPKKKESLLKNVLNSETKKKNESSSKKSPMARERRHSGLEIMMASQKNKFPTPVKLQKSPLLTDFEILVGKEKTPSRSILKKTPKTGNSSKGHVSFKKQAENRANAGGRGLSEKYFQPSSEDDSSPMRVVLGDLGNVTPSGMTTRSRKRQMTFSGLISPQVN